MLVIINDKKKIYIVVFCLYLSYSRHYMKAETENDGERIQVRNRILITS